MATSRRHGREVALQALYGTEVGKRPVSDILNELLARDDSSDGRVFVRDLVMGTLENENESDAVIAPRLEGWTLDRLPTIDRIILRMSVFELRHRKETDSAVVLNEAVELAKKFSTEDSGRYVNGVLARILGPAMPAAQRTAGTASVPEPQRGTASVPERERGTASVPEPQRGTASVPEPQRGTASVPERERGTDW